MKTFYNFVIILILFSQNLQGQQIFNSKILPEDLLENRKLVIFFESNVTNKEKQNIESIIKTKVDSTITILEKKELKALRKSHSEDFLIVKVNSVSEQIKSRLRISNKTLSYSYYSFTLSLSEDGKRLAQFNTFSNSISSVDVILAFMFLDQTNYLISSCSWRDLNKCVNKNLQEGETLIVASGKVGLSYLEKNNCLPKAIMNPNNEELLRMLSDKKTSHCVAYASSITGTAGKEFYTIIFDLNSGSIIKRYRWKI